MSDLMLLIHQNIALVSALVVAVAALVVFERVFAKRGVKELSSMEATLKIKQKKSLVLDIRESAEFIKGHIAQSKNLLTVEVPAKMKSLAKTLDAPILVICSSGISALSIARKIHKAGYTDVSILKGGIQGWIKEHLPLVTPAEPLPKAASSKKREKLKSENNNGAH